MPRGGRPVGSGAVFVLAAMMPALFGRAIPGGDRPWLAEAGLLLMVFAIAWSLGGLLWPKFRAAVALAAAAVVGIATHLSGVAPQTVALATTGSLDTAAYGALLAWFAASLRPGREPVVTGFARRLRTAMPQKVSRYTRRVTIAWCVFFAAHLLASATLLLCAPAAIWSGFVGLLNVPLLTAMMLGEFACRLLLFRHEPHTSLGDTIAALRGGLSVRRDQP